MGLSGSKNRMLISKYRDLDKNFKELNEVNKVLTEERLNLENDKNIKVKKLNDLVNSFNNLKVVNKLRYFACSSGIFVDSCPKLSSSTLQSFAHISWISFNVIIMFIIIDS